MSDLADIYASLDDSPIIRENYIRAPFNYIGNKFRSLDEILPRLPYMDTWVDVFGGTGIVTLNRRPCKLEVYNDRWSGLVAFYRCVRDAVKIDQLLERINLTVHSREEFIWCKQTWENCEDDVERAARFYYMIQASFGGRGKYFGRILSPTTPVSAKIYENLPGFGEIHARFRNVQVENLDFRECFKDFDSPATVFYLDPPYYGSNIYEVQFFKKDHCEMLERIFQLKGFVALSGFANDAYSAFPWDSIYSWERPGKMTPLTTKTETSFVAGRDDLLREAVTECLWIKECY